MPTALPEAASGSGARDASRPRVLVAGGGVAGLEALLALRDLSGDRAQLVLLCPEPEFAYQPVAINPPFGRGRADHHALAEIAAGLGAELVPAALMEVDAGGHAVITSSGRRLAYDALLVAVGASSEPAFHHVLTWTPQADAALFGGLLRDLDEGYTKRVAFVVPPGAAWAHPAYELALVTARHAWGMGHDDVQVTLYAPEEPFGPAARRDLEQAGVRVQTGVHVVEDAHAPGRLVLQPGERRLDAERVVALPRAVGPAIPGLPADDRGFIPADEHGRVPGTAGVWAAGDAVAFPVKPDGLATQQADAAAESIAAHLGADLDPRPFRPDPRGMAPTSAGRYLSSYLAALGGGPSITGRPRPTTSRL